MKYADKVIELMASYPGREFRMVEIVRYVAPARPINRGAVREGVRLVLDSLAKCGSIVKHRPGQRGGFAVYRWR